MIASRSCVETMQDAQKMNHSNSTVIVQKVTRDFIVQVLL